MKNNKYGSKIYSFGKSLYFGTVGADNLQNLLMEATFAVGGEVLCREVTNVDEAALKDIGCSWVNLILCFKGNGGPISWTDGEEGTFDAVGPASALTGKYYRVIKN